MDWFLYDGDFHYEKVDKNHLKMWTWNVKLKILTKMNFTGYYIASSCIVSLCNIIVIIICKIFVIASIEWIHVALESFLSLNM